MKTIWCISKYANPENYGFSNKLYNTAQHLSNRYNVTLISSTASKNNINMNRTGQYYEETIGNLKSVLVKQTNRLKMITFWRLLQWFTFDAKLGKYFRKSTDKPDLIIISSVPITTIAWALHIKKKYNIKVVFEVRDIYPLTLIDMGYSKFNPLILYFSHLERKAYLESDLIVGTMPNLKEHVENVTRKKCNAFHSPIGLNPRFELNVNQEAQIINDGVLRIYYSGTINKGNNLDTFFNMIREFSNDSRVHFTIIGDGNLLNYYQKKTKNLKNITYLGRIKSTEIKSAISNADVLYFSTSKGEVWKYGQSKNKILEYMASGKFIMAAFEGYASMINETNGVIITEPDNLQQHIATLNIILTMTKKELHHKGSTNIKIIKNSYTYETINKEYQSKIEEILYN